jgi:DMSO/TMAO reductase YedYZ molybdopterin-dependent catalytic subunit
MDIHCVTRWSKFDTVWEGVSLKMMVANGLIKIKPKATHLMQHAEYGFTVNLPLEVALQDNFLEQAGYHNRADVWREERFG